SPKADEKTPATHPDTTPSQRTLSVRWLAHVMAYAADTLSSADISLPKEMPAYPTAVEKNRVLRQHWPVYWTIPKSYRGDYVQALAQTPHKTIADNLATAPDSTGWRLRTEQLATQWETALPALFAKPPHRGAIPESAKTAIAE